MLCHPLSNAHQHTMQVFEKGNFAGLEEMKKNDKLFARVAPMGINDILMAIQYRHEERAPLAVPIVSFEGLTDATIDPNNMAQWEQYTASSYRNVPVMGDHYFISTHYQEVNSLSSLKAGRLSRHLSAWIRQ